MEGAPMNGNAKQKLTIAHFMPWGSIGGIEIATVRMAAAMGREFRNLAFCLSEAKELRALFEKSGTETVEYAPPEPSLRHAAQFYSDSRRVARQLKLAQVDIVHFSEGKAAYHNSLAAMLAGSRMVCHIRNRYNDVTLRDRLTQKPVHKYIFVSEDSRRTYPVPLPMEKTCVVYDAVEIPDPAKIETAVSVRAEFSIPQEDIIVGMVARVNPQKDYDTLAEAAAEVLKRHPNTRFMVVGDNAIVDLNRQHYAEVAAKLADLGIAGKFTFTGYREDVSRLISAMDIFVLSTHREGFPLCILEAMSMEKPVVATAVDGIPEVIAHGTTGYLHAHGNSAELAAAITGLIEDPELAKKLGSAGLEQVKQVFTPESFTKNMAKVYRDTMNHS